MNWMTLSNRGFRSYVGPSRPTEYAIFHVEGLVDCGPKIVQNPMRMCAYSCVTPPHDARSLRPHLLQTERAPMSKSLPAGGEKLTAEEVHDITGVPVSTLHDWAAKRERGMRAPGPHHIRLSNRHRRWARRDVDEWIELARI